MKISRLEKIYAVTIAVIFGGVVVHAPLSVGLGVLFPDYDLLIKSWKEILMLALIPVAVTILSRRNMWKELAADWIFRLIIAYSALHVTLAGFLYNGAAATAAGLAIDLRYVLFFGLVYVLVRILPDYRPVLLKVGLIGACIVVGFAALQLFLPPDILKYIGYSKDTIAPYLTVDQNPDYIRVNSTLRGPNPLGAYAGIVLALIAAGAVRKKLAVRNVWYVAGVGLVGLCSLVALWISYSRSALVAAIVGVGIVLAITIARRLSVRVWISVVVATVAIIGGLVAAQNSTFVSNVILHENPVEGNSVNSNDGHIASLEDGFARMIRQPIGAGVGSTGSASLYGDLPVIVENQYLFIAHESGWLGLGLFMVLFAMILWRLWNARQDWLCLGVFASGIGLAVIGLLLPVWADDTVAIVWWGLAGVALASHFLEDAGTIKENSGDRR
jgi:hypothetical protein